MQTTNPYDHFSPELVDKTHSFIATLNGPDIPQYQRAYQRELLSDKFLTPREIEQMRCFLYLTKRDRLTDIKRMVKSD